MKRSRKHGCQFPWSIQFIFSWVFVFLSGILYYFFYDPFFSIFEVRVFLTFTTSLLWILCLGFGLCLILSDPSDIRILLYKDIEKSNSVKDCRYCLVCKVNVHKESLHCKYCNKCVYRLDHHCFYVNNCIGKSNYSLYITSMILATLFSMWNWAISLYVFSTYFLDVNFFSRIKQILYIQSNEVVVCIIVIFILVSGVVWIYLTWLLHFHYLLSRRGMTSLEYTRSKKISATLE